MDSMNTSASTTPRSSTGFGPHSPDVEQLTLLPQPQTPTRFLLSKDTRERGLRHVAEIRKMLASRAENPRDVLQQRDQAA